MRDMVLDFQEEALHKRVCALRLANEA